jgi:trans-aconitate 2-methyltransferase
VTPSWNASLYQSSCSFVWEYGKDLLALLAPQPGERILDVGCGTGQLTAEIARAGAAVTGIDSSAEMIGKARAGFPDLRLEIHDVCDLPFRGEFDAVFSNAVLHWVPRAEDAVRSMARALKSGGRFVIEMGGRRNTQAVMDASDRALRALGVAAPERFHPWYYPGIAEYSAMLERHGVEVTFATLFDRPTALGGGDDALSTWLEMFAGRLTEGLDPSRISEYRRLTCEFAAPVLKRPDGWYLDYRRLRVTGRKIGEQSLID